MSLSRAVRAVRRQKLVADLQNACFAAKQSLLTYKHDERGSPSGLQGVRFKWAVGQAY